MTTRFISALCLGASVVGVLNAAPPTLAPLFPAGGQSGTVVEINSSTKLWSSSKSLTFAPAKDKAKPSLKIAADAAPGVYWLRAVNDDGASAMRPFLVGTLPEVMEKEPNDESKQPQSLAESCLVNGKLAKSGDVDCFAIAAKKGQVLVAAVEANQALKSPMDSVLQIVSPDGFVLDENHDFHGLDPLVAYTVPKDGTYLVRVFAFPSAPDTSIRFSGADSYIYRLTITTGGYLDHTEPLAAGPSLKSVAARGWNIPDDAKSLPVPKPVRFEDLLPVFHPKLAGAFGVRFDLHAEAKGPVPPFASTHRLAKPGVDVRVPLTAKKGQTLAIAVESRSFGLDVDPVIRVLDKDGKQLARAEPAKLSSDTSLSFAPQADGEYSIAVSDLYAGGGPRHAFLLRAKPPVPDYELTLATDRFTIPPGKSVDVPIKIVRRNGFAKPVVIAAEDLPAGVTFAIKPPTGKADPNLITVTLSAEKAGPGGAFRLVGTVKDEPALARAATAPLSDFDSSTIDLWVNVSEAGATPPPKKKRR